MRPLYRGIHRRQHAPARRRDGETFAAAIVRAGGTLDPLLVLQPAQHLADRRAINRNDVDQGRLIDARMHLDGQQGRILDRGHVEPFRLGHEDRDRDLVQPPDEMTGPAIDRMIALAPHFSSRSTVVMPDLVPGIHASISAFGSGPAARQRGMLHAGAVPCEVHALLLGIDVLLQQRLGARSLAGLERAGDGVMLSMRMVEQVEHFVRAFLVESDGGRHHERDAVQPGHQVADDAVVGGLHDGVVEALVHLPVDELVALCEMAFCEQRVTLIKAALEPAQQHVRHAALRQQTRRHSFEGAADVEGGDDLIDGEDAHRIAAATDGHQQPFLGQRRQCLPHRRARDPELGCNHSLRHPLPGREVAAQDHLADPQRRLKLVPHSSGSQCDLARVGYGIPNVYSGSRHGRIGVP